MTEYKKWLEKFYSTHQGDRHFNPDAQYGWRAALEWATHATHKPYYDHYDLTYKLHKELSDD